MVTWTHLLNPIRTTLYKSGPHHNSKNYKKNPEHSRKSSKNGEIQCQKTSEKLGTCPSEIEMFVNGRHAVYLESKTLGIHQLTTVVKILDAFLAIKPHFACFGRFERPTFPPETGWGFGGFTRTLFLRSGRKHQKFDPHHTIRSTLGRTPADNNLLNKNILTLSRKADTHTQTFFEINHTTCTG